ncbi:hypothetical protein [Synechocystis sp. LKSZ1]
MTDKYQNKYRITSIRLPHWDYRYIHNNPLQWHLDRHGAMGD